MAEATNLSLTGDIGTRFMPQSLALPMRHPSCILRAAERRADACDASGNALTERHDMIRVRNSIEEQIQYMVRRIVAEFDPDRIILFGSYARGQAGPDSDVDLLVVMPVKGSKRAKQLEIRAMVRDVHVPKDIIVSTTEEFQWRKDTVGTIEYPAVREGKTLYARK